MDKSRVFKRAWKVVKAKDITISKALKWSWKIEKENAETVYHKDWCPSDVETFAGQPKYFRRYFSDNSYIAFRMSHFDKCAEYSYSKIEGGIARQMVDENNYTAYVGFKAA